MRRPLVAAVGLLGLLAFASSGGAQSDDDLSRLRTAIEASRERVASYERDERGLLEAIEAIEESTRLLHRDAERARREAREARAALEKAEGEADRIEVSLARLERAMKRRAVALYRAGELGAVPLLFSAGSLRGFFSRVQILRRLLVHDRDLLAQHRLESDALEATRLRAASASAAAAKASSELGERNRQLDEERGRKRHLARQLGRSRARERGALAELEIAATALEETMSAWHDAPSPAAPVPLLPGPAFASRKAQLLRPVDGSESGRFGRIIDRESLTATFRKGVVFSAELGTPVIAVAPGRVRYAGRFRGYGNVVILDHGEDYFTVSGHLDPIEVGLGHDVQEGERVGRVGETGSLSGPRLYFEVRRGAKPLDPTDWLAPVGTAALRR